MPLVRLWVPEPLPSKHVSKVPAKPTFTTETQAGQRTREGGEGAGGTHVMRDRSRMTGRREGSGVRGGVYSVGEMYLISCMAVVLLTIDPRIPTTPGRSMSGFHRPGRHCLHQARSAVRCWASRVKGELHPTTKRSRSGFSCIRMTASTN